MLDPKDIRSECYCNSGGPTGPLKLTHIPTGISAESEITKDNPSHKARATAYAELERLVRHAKV